MPSGFVQIKTKCGSAAVLHAGREES